MLKSMIKRLVYMLLVLMFVFGCSQNSGSDDSGNGESGGGPGGGGTDYQTIKFLSDGSGYTQLYTNDPKYVRSGIDGYSFWYASGVSQETVGYDVEIEVRKKSGDYDGGAGLIFCVQDDINDYLVVWVTPEGKYAIEKIVDKVKSNTIQAYTSSTNIPIGYDKPNKIRVKYNSVKSKFELYLNGVLTLDFIDGDTTPYIKGRWGYIGCVTEDDSFPATPLDIRFKQVL